MEISRQEIEDDLERIDLESLKFDAIVQLRQWQKKMHGLIDRTYHQRLKEIESRAVDRFEQIQIQQDELRHLDAGDHEHLEQIHQEIERLKSSVQLVESIPATLEQRIARTILIKNDDEEEEEEEELVEFDDEPVIVDIDHDQEKHGDRVTLVVAAPPASSNEGTVSRVFNSQPVQHAIGVTLARALTHVGTAAAASTTTVAATTMAKTAVIAAACGVGTVAYGVGKVAIGTTKTLWSLFVSSDE